MRCKMNRGFSSTEGFYIHGVRSVTLFVIAVLYILCILCRFSVSYVCVLRS